MTRKHLLTLATLAGILLSAPPALAQFITTNDGTGGLSGFVQHDAGFGNPTDQFHVKNSGDNGSTTRKGYVRFDISSLSGSVTVASFDLVVSQIQSTIGGTDQTIYVYGLTDETQDSWDPVTTTWANAPGNDTESGHLADLSEATLLGTFELDFNGDKASPEGTVVSFSSPQLIAFLNDDTNDLVTIVLGRTPTGATGSQNLLFASEAHASYDPPTLIVSTTTDTTPPLLVSTDPVDDETSAPLTDNLVATFDELVMEGTGNIELWEVGGGAAVETFNVASSGQLAFDGLTLTIDPTDDLLPDTEYYVLIPATTITDGNNNPFAGLSAPPVSPNWTFSTPPITVLNETSDQVPDFSTFETVVLEDNPYTISFDAGASADKIVVTLSGEIGGSSGLPPSIAYDGNPLVRIGETIANRNLGIWYLDLAGTGYAGGNADLTVDMTSYSIVNGIGFGVVSLDGTAPGFAAGNAASNLSVSLDTPVEGGIVVTNHASQETSSQIITVPAGHVELYAGAIGSAKGGSSYLNNVAAGSAAYTYQNTFPDADRVSAAAFAPASSSPYDAWATTNSLSGGDALVTTDVEPDGLVNLLEFAFGTDPNTPDNDSLETDGTVNGLPLPVSSGGGGGTTFDLLFVRLKDSVNMGTLVYTPQFSSDLMTFHDSGSTPAFVVDSSDDSNYEIVKVPYPTTLPPDNQKARFARVKVELLP